MEVEELLARLKIARLLIEDLDFKYRNGYIDVKYFFGTKYPTNEQWLEALTLQSQ